jgi:hypothetical protein
MGLGLATVLVAGAGVLGGCADTSASGGGGTAAAPSATAIDTAEPGAIRTTVTASLTSERTELATVGPGAQRVFGWNMLTGQGVLLGQPVQVRVQGVVEYINGSGPFGGFLRLIAEDGSELAFTLDGQATEGDRTKLRGRLDLIGATGSYEPIVAVGSFEATRDNVVGATVEAVVELTLDTNGVG